MRYFLRSIGAVGAWLLLLVSPAMAQQKGEVCGKARQLLQTIRTYHVAPPAADSLFGQRVLQQFVHTLDPYGLYLTQQEVAQLHPLFSRLEEQSRQNNCLFAEEATRLFARQYRFADSLRQALLKYPMQWQQTDTLYLSLSTYPPLAANRQELALRWLRQLKYMLLMEAYAESGGEGMNLANQEALRAKVLDRLNCRRSRMLETPRGLQEYVEESLLEALASSFDPHTNFLPQTLKQQFEASLSVEAESFGIALEENRQGDVQISQLSPGGPAWKSNELHQGDVLLLLRPKRGNTKSFSCTSLDEAARLLHDADHQHIYLTVRKQSGKIKTVELIREKLQVEENVVQSFVLSGARKIGYLALPGFYTQWDEQGQERGCAQDVARELLKMRRQGVEGLILDLRYNGGGSVQEALNLAGIFIDEGPLGIEHSRGDSPRLMRDRNRGTLFDAPLLVLVNGFSASASEILVRSLQEYNRALVVGSKTWGKASLQSLIPLHATLPGWDAQEAANDDFVKVTVSRFYDLSGHTYQYHGVLPDVLLEDGLAALAQHESAYPTALRPTSLQKKIVYHPLPPLPVQEIAQKSKARLLQDRRYERQLSQARQLEAATRRGFALRLTPEAFQQDYAGLNKLLGRDEEMVDMLPAFELSLLEGQPRLEQNAQQQEAQAQQLKELRQDAWLGEAYHIMLDLLDAAK